PGRLCLLPRRRDEAGRGRAAPPFRPRAVDRHGARHADGGRPRVRVPSETAVRRRRQRAVAAHEHRLVDRRDRRAVADPGGAVAIRSALSTEPDTGSAVLIALAVVIIGVRLLHSTRADRRYAALLENEVASQTRSLMDSLSATGAAERNLRLLMEAVPDAIVVVDREGRILESNRPTHVLGALV